MKFLILLASLSCPAYFLQDGIKCNGAFQRLSWNTVYPCSNISCYFYYHADVLEYDKCSRFNSSCPLKQKKGCVFLFLHARLVIVPQMR